MLIVSRRVGPPITYIITLGASPLGAVLQVCSFAIQNGFDPWLVIRRPRVVHLEISS